MIQDVLDVALLVAEAIDATGIHPPGRVLTAPC